MTFNEPTKAEKIGRTIGQATILCVRVALLFVVWHFAVKYW